MRAAFEAWLLDTHLLTSEWQESRNCFKDYPAHLAFKAWQAATAAEQDRCAKVVEAEHVGESVDDECDNEEDSAYNLALRHAAAAIRAD